MKLNRFLGVILIVGSLILSSCSVQTREIGFGGGSWSMPKSSNSSIASENTNVDLTDQHEYKTTTQDLTVVPIESGQTVPIRNVFFETGKAQLAAESSLELNRLVPIIQRHSNFSLEISGHTDDVGTDENNKSLSDKRANAVLKYLTSKGVSANRVVAVGYGESKPLVPNDSEYNRSFNRRVEFTVR